MFSATIDQIRLRRAMNLPLDSQNFWSSGFQSEIQVGFCSLIRRVPFNRALPRTGARSREARFGGGQNSDDCFRATASVASAIAIQALCQAPAPKIYHLYQLDKRICWSFLHGGFAFKICDSLICCAPHKE